MPSVLLLNADAAPLSLLPLSTISWQSAVKTIFGDKVHVIKNYEGRFIRSTSLSIPMPSVVMLTKYHKQPTKAKYTRRNVYIRDDYYVLLRWSMNDELTLDHVIPTKGGRLGWTNTVAACGPCKKGNKIIKPITPDYMARNKQQRINH